MLAVRILVAYKHRYVRVYVVLLLKLLKLISEDDSYEELSIIETIVIVPVCQLEYSLVIH
jgi:hypothetical protein